MPRFYLHLRFGPDFVEDDEGYDLADVEAARAEAVAGVRSIISDEVRTGRINLAACIDIADASGSVLTTLRFRDAVTLLLDDEHR